MKQMFFDSHISKDQFEWNQFQQKKDRMHQSVQSNKQFYENSRLMKFSSSGRNETEVSQPDVASLPTFYPGSTKNNANRMNVP